MVSARSRTSLTSRRCGSMVPDRRKSCGFASPWRQRLGGSETSVQRVFGEGGVPRPRSWPWQHPRSIASDPPQVARVCRRCADWCAVGPPRVNPPERWMSLRPSRRGGRVGQQKRTTSFFGRVGQKKRTISFCGGLLPSCVLALTERVSARSNARLSCSKPRCRGVHRR